MTQQEARIKKWEKEIEEAKYLQEQLIKHYDLLDIVITDLEIKIRFERNFNREKKNLNARKKGELLRRIEKQFGKEEKTKE